MQRAGVHRYLQKRREPMRGGVLESSREEVPLMTPESVVDYHVNRLGFGEEAKVKLNELADSVALIESEGNPQAMNESTSASGAFQFVKDSVMPALNRMQDATGSLPEWAEGLRMAYERGLTKEQHQKLMTSLSYEQQKELFLADILEKTIDNKPGYGDKLLKKFILNDSPEAVKELYYKGHHTAPDEATIARVEEKL